jgi:hypothetical protein
MINHYLPSIIHHCNTPIEKTVTTGFDGFVDTIVRIIKHKDPSDTPIFFKKIDDFGQYIVAKNNNSFSLETQEVSTKLGGNMPILSNALGFLGVRVQCIGALGYPQIHTAFKNMPSQCALYSFADPGISTAYEFENGKMMLAQNGLLNTLAWADIKTIIGLERLNKLYAESALFCLLNWSEIDASTDIWHGLLKDVMPFCPKAPLEKMAFFDLSDCSNRSDVQIKEALDLMLSFNTYAKIILSLNKNEARHLYQVLYEKPTENKAFSFIGKLIQEKLPVEILLLHTAKESIAFTKSMIQRVENPFFMDNPTLSTGAGDNFNAGFCAALLMEMDVVSALIFAHAVSAMYVQKGESPDMAAVVSFLKSLDF